MGKMFNIKPAKFSLLLCLLRYVVGYMFDKRFVWFPSLYKDIKLLYVQTFKMQVLVVLLILIYFSFPDIVVLD